MAGRFLREITFFVCNYRPETIPEEYSLFFLNYLAAACSGAKENAVSIAARYAAEENPGAFQPLGRKEHLSAAGCVRTDCFSSAIQAYDDIHFETTAHPCGPVASALLGIVRRRPVTLKEFLEALLAGMETECRTGIFLFQEGSKGWYTTSVCGTIGAAAGCARLLGLSDIQTENALALAASYACGNRGTHGSMAGSWMPAIAAEKGYEAAILASLGFTCSPSSFDGALGMVNQITDTPSELQALAGLGKKLISRRVSCKPYPYGFISFGVLECLGTLKPQEEIEEVILEVSRRVSVLGKNPYPATMYEGFVSLPFITARALLNPESLYLPLSEKIELSEAEKELIPKIKIIPCSKFTDDTARVTVLGGKGSETIYCEEPSGSSKKPMEKEQVIRKAQLLNPEDTIITDILSDPRGHMNRRLVFAGSRLIIE